MSFADERSHKNDQKEPEICLQENDKANKSDPEDQKDKNMRIKYLLKTNQREKRTISPLNLLKEDFSHLKEEVLKVFKDKETKTEHKDHRSNEAENKLDNSTISLLKEDLSHFKEDVTSVFSISSTKDKDLKTEHKDCPSSQAENKPASSILGLLKEDFSHFKEDVTSIFSTSSSKDKETKSTEKMSNPLSLLKEDLNHLKDDLSNVFRIGLSKERDVAKEDSSNTAKIKVSKAGRTDEPCKSHFRRDQKTTQKAENSQAVKKTLSETSEEQMDDSFNELEDSELDITASGEKTETSLSKTQQSEEMIPTSQADEQICESEEWSDASTVVSVEDKKINEEEEEVEEEEEEEKPLDTLPWEALSSGISLFSLRDDMRDQPGGDLWSVKNFACYLTFDPNTANSELRLTDCNRKVIRLWSDHQPSDHPDRFERCPQVLCREGLLDPVYWEVIWRGGADIGVTYNSISRDGDTASCLLGHNKQSWSLECSEGSYTPCHNNKRFKSSSPRPFTHRVGVYLDWSAGCLSFYCVSQDTMVHLHTFTSTFTEPLYPGFWVWAYDGSVSLCQVELDWERLLQ